MNAVIIPQMIYHSSVVNKSTKKSGEKHLKSSHSNISTEATSSQNITTNSPNSQTDSSKCRNNKSWRPSIAQAKKSLVIRVEVIFT